MACTKVAPKFDAFDATRLRYYLDYLSFLDAFGLPDDIAVPCRKLNEIRNKFAHRGAWTLERSQVDELVAALPAEFHKVHTSSTEVAWYARHFKWSEGTPLDHLTLACADLSKYVWNLEVSPDKTLSTPSIWVNRRGALFWGTDGDG